MPWREHLHSRMVAWLKVILPMAALALLSTLFLFSRNIDPTTTIPFTTIPLEERARDERVSRPEFAGATERFGAAMLPAITVIQRDNLEIVAQQLMHGVRSAPL